jgi:hypothetical protein
MKGIRRRRQFWIKIKNQLLQLSASRTTEVTSFKLHFILDHQIVNLRLLVKPSLEYLVHYRETA